MPRSIRYRRLVAALVCMAGVLLTAAMQSTPVQAQASGLPSGTVRGVVTAATISGDTVGASNVLVTLWTTDATTEAMRDSACTAWLSDKTTWLQARQETAAPSGIDWTGTKMEKDVNLLTRLMSLRRDTTRTNENGEFEFASVPIGAYTIEAETFASDRFLQWNRDLAAIPSVVTMVRLGPSTLAENQYCNTSASAKGSAVPGVSPGSRSPPNILPALRN